MGIILLFMMQLTYWLCNCYLPIKSHHLAYLNKGSLQFTYITSTPLEQEKEDKGHSIASQIHLVSSSLASTQLPIGHRICLFPFENWFIHLSGASNFSPLVQDLVKFTSLPSYLTFSWYHASFLTWKNQVGLFLSDTFFFHVGVGELSLSFKWILLTPMEKEDAFPHLSCSEPGFLKLSTIEIWTR